MKTSLQLAVFGLGAFAAAQFGALPACAKGCATSSLPKSCNLDVKCICADQSFISGISCCVKTACSPDDQKSTLQVAQQLCSTVGVTLPSAATCPGDSSSAPASEASSAGSSSAASSAASAPASSASSPASSSSPESSSPSASSAAGASSASSASSQSSAASAGGSSSAGAATGSPSASSTSPSSTGGAVKDIGSKLGAVGAAVAALYLI